MTKKIVSFGAIYCDINYTRFPLPDQLQLDTEIVGSDYSVELGGSAVIFARVASSLGMEPVFIGKIGVDMMGSAVTKLMEEEHITPSFITNINVSTNISSNFVRGDGKSLMTVAGSANQEMTGDEVKNKLFENLPQVQYLYLGGSFKLKNVLPFYQQIILKAKSNGVKIILDHGRVTNATSEEDKKIIRDNIQHIDYYLPSRDELLSVWGETDIKTAMMNIKSKMGGVIVVKDSTNGSLGIATDEIVECPIFPVALLNTVGAGDSFNAGFVFAQSEGLHLLESLRFASATAALKISRFELPSLFEVKKLVEAK